MGFFGSLPKHILGNRLKIVLLFKCLESQDIEFDGSRIMAEDRSKLIKVIDVGYKLCLTLGVAVLLIMYRDVSFKEHALSNEIASLKQAQLDGDTRLRKRRSIGLDIIFHDITRRIDSLERRFVCICFG